MTLSTRAHSVQQIGLSLCFSYSLAGLFQKHPISVGILKNPRIYPSSSLMLLLSAALFLWGLYFGWSEIQLQRTVNIEVDGDFLIAATCRLQGYCPMFAVDIRPGFQLGNYYSLILTGVQFLSENPSVFFGLGLVLHALSSVILFHLGASLFGLIPGIMAGFLMSVSIPVLELYRTSVPAAFSIIFTCTAWFFLWRWAEGSKRAPLWLVGICASLAPQIHLLATIPLIALLPLCFVGLRKRGFGRDVFLASGLFLLFSAPILASVFGLIWGAFSGGANPQEIGSGGGPGLLARYLGENWLAVGSENISRGFQSLLSNPHRNWPADLPWFLCGLGSLAVLISSFSKRKSSATRKALSWGILLSTFAAYCLFAGLSHKWKTRYGFIFYPSIIVLSLWGFQWTVEKLEKIIPRFALPISILAAATFLTLYADRRNDPQPQLIDTFKARGLHFPEQIEILEALAPLGFQYIDFQSRLHGSLWNPYELMFAYPALNLGHAAPAAGQRTSTSHAVLIEKCTEIPEGFSIESHRINHLDRRSILATYEPSWSDLDFKVYHAPPCESAECDEAAGECTPTLCEEEFRPCLAGDALFTTVSRAQHWDGLREILEKGTDTPRRSMPIVLTKNQQKQWSRCWEGQGAEARIRANIQAPREARTLVLSHDAQIAPFLFLDKVHFPEIRDEGRREHHPFGRKTSRYKLPSAQDGKAEIKLEVVLKKAANVKRGTSEKGQDVNTRWGFQYPLYLDLFEEPFPRCAKPLRKPPGRGLERPYSQ